jgi:Putative esterase
LPRFLCPRPNQRPRIIQSLQKLTYLARYRPGEPGRPTYPPRPAAVAAVAGSGTAQAGSARQQRPALNFSTFEEVFIEELVYNINSTYRTIADRDHRAMAGLSMGGMQTFRITLDHLDKFAYIGGLSGAGAE